MMTPPTMQAPQYPVAPAAPAMVRPSRPSRFGFFFGIAATVLTLGAIALAVFAPQLTAVPKLAVPAGWQQVYNNNPSADMAPWDASSGCGFPSSGMVVESDSTCAFSPEGSAQLSGGVLVVAQVAPAANVSAAQDAGILIDNTVVAIMSQDGNYRICDGSCDVFSRTNLPPVTGSTVAWHADAFVANEIAVLDNPDQGKISFYVNGQFVNEFSDSELSSTPTVALITTTTGEAQFTHVAIYAASVG